MKKRAGIVAAALGALALAGATLVVPASANSNAPDGTRVTSQSGQSGQTSKVAAAGADENGTATKAAGNAFFSASGVNIRTGPGTNRTILGQGQKNQPVQVHSCGHGNPGNWYYLTNLATGVKGYVYWPNNVLFRYGVPQPPTC